MPALIPRLWRAAPLARRLTLALVAALLVALIGLLAGAYWVSHGALRVEWQTSARRIVRVFESGLQTAMLRRDLPGLAEFLTTLGTQPGVKSAALLNRAGEVRFASHAADLGAMREDLVDALCIKAGCEVADDYIEMLDSDDRLRISYPIRNQTRCSECHGSVSEHPVNGVLVVEFDAPRRVGLGSQARQLLPVGIGALTLLTLVIWWLVRREVIGPVGRLAAVSARVAQGDLQARVGMTTGGELGALGDQMDATTQRLGQMLRQIEESRSFLQNLLDAAPDPVLVIDSDYRIVLSNRAYDRMLGTPPQGVAGLPCHQVSRGLREPCPATIVRCPLAELRTSAEPMRTVMTLKRADGSDVSVEIHAAPVTAADGRRLIFEVIRPLDAQVRFSQEQRLSAVGLLANGVAHEIRNPLASIRLALQSCLRGLRERTLDSAEITEYLELVDQEIDRCVLTTQRLLALSEPPGDSRAVRLALAIDDVRALLAAEADSAKVRIELDLQPADAAVLADEAELRQVILNLMQNAFHAMPQGGRLAISLRRHGAFLRLSISDEGVGIAPEDLSLIFLPFFSRRADGRRGTGLGLAICKAMVERHGGRIAVDSQVGRGSTFSVELRAANEEGS